jgi:hypothetical protein
MSELNYSPLGLIAKDTYATDGLPYMASLILAPPPEGVVELTSEHIRTPAKTSFQEKYPTAHQLFKAPTARPLPFDLIILALNHGDRVGLPELAEDIREQLGDYRIFESPTSNVKDMINKIWLPEVELSRGRWSSGW